MQTEVAQAAQRMRVAAELVIGEQHSFTNGRIIVAECKVRRGKQQRADFLLYCRRDFPLAVVGAKEVGLPANHRRVEQPVRKAPRRRWRSGRGPP